MRRAGAAPPRRHLLLALVLAALLAVPAAGLTLTVQDRSVEPNGTVVVPITVADAQDLGGVDLVLAFDPAVLRLESAAPGSLAGRARVSSSETGPGRVAVAVASPGSLTGTGPIVALTFAAVGPAGARSTVALEAVRAVTVDDDPVPAQVVNGTVSVGGGAGAAGIAVRGRRGACSRRGIAPEGRGGGGPGGSRDRVRERVKGGPQQVSPNESRSSWKVSSTKSTTRERSLSPSIATG